MFYAYALIHCVRICMTPFHLSESIIIYSLRHPSYCDKIFCVRFKLFKVKHFPRIFMDVASSAGIYINTKRFRLFHLLSVSSFFMSPKFQKLVLKSIIWSMIIYFMDNLSIRRTYLNKTIIVSQTEKNISSQPTLIKPPWITELEDLFYISPFALARVC